jgi:hypothetical protein
LAIDDFFPGPTASCRVTIQNPKYLLPKAHMGNVPMIQGNPYDTYMFCVKISLRDANILSSPFHDASFTFLDSPGVQEHIAKYSWHKGHDDNSRILIHGSS